MTYNEEVWRDVVGWESIYQVSNYGRLKSFKVDPSGKIMKQTNKNGDYFSVVLQADGRRMKSIRMHRIVAEAFIPNPKKLPQVNHIDRNKQNNHVSNLEWCNPSENVIHSVNMNPNQLSGMLRYNRHTKTKRIIQLSKEGKALNVFVNSKEAAAATGVCARNILQVCSKTPYGNNKNTRKQAGGFFWCFASEVMQK